MNNSSTSNSNNRVHRMTTRSQSRTTRSENEIHENTEVVAHNDDTNSSNIGPNSQSGNVTSVPNDSPESEYNVALRWLLESTSRLRESSGMVNAIPVDNDISEPSSDIHEQWNDVIHNIAHNIAYNIRQLHVNISRVEVTCNALNTVPIRWIELDKIDGTIKHITKCLICCEDNVTNAILKPCNHENMCTNCINKWESRTCPICRADIKEMVAYYAIN